MALTYPAAEAARLAEIARSDPDSLLQRIFAKLVSDGRFAGKQDVLTAKNTEVVKVLHDMLQQTVSEANGMRVKQRVMTQMAVIRRDAGKPVLDANGTPVSDVHEVWNGQWLTGSEDVFTHLDTLNKYNPRIQQQTTKTNQQHANYDLRSRTGDSTELFTDAERKIDADMYDNLQLIRMALQLLEAKEQTAQLDAQEMAALPRGNRHQEFAAAAQQELSYKWRMRARFAGRLAMLAAVLAVGTGIASRTGIHLPDASHDDSDYSLPSSLRTPVWHIENHGLANDDPYWRQAGQYAFGGGVWYDPPTQQPFTESIPAELPDPYAPHETVTSVFAGPQVWLPIQEGTKVGAVRLTELAGGKVEPNNQMLAADGNVLVQATGGNPFSVFKLQYDLVPAAPDEGFHPMYPIMVEDVSPYRPDPAAYPGHADPVRYIKNTFTYDDGDDLKRLLSRANARDYTDIVYEHQRCQCVQCNTVAAILNAEQHPSQNMAMVGGYLNTENTGSTAYLTDNEGHAWFDDGKIRDATAVKTDSNSHLPQAQPGESAADLLQQQLKDGNVAAMRYGVHTAQEQKHMMQDVPWRNIWKPVAGLALLGAGWLELRRKYLQRTAAHAVRAGNWLTAAAAIDPRDAVRLMDWHAYGAARSPMPPADKGMTYQGEQPHAVPDAVLDQIVMGGFRGNDALSSRQRRGLKRTARAIRRERRMTGRA